MDQTLDEKALVDLAADIVSAYVSNHMVVARELPSIIEEVHEALRRAHIEKHENKDLTPAVPIKKSIKPDFIICLEDGKKFKSLKRHLRTRYGLSPEEYREKWGLPYDYPMVAPNYAAVRAELARKMGLGKGN